MAVQAQYPSNILLLNRNLQDEHDYLLQPQHGGLVLDQHHNLVLHNNGNSNSSPKRGREVSVKTGVEQNNNVMNTTIFEFESPPPQLIELSQLHNHHHQQQQNVSTGLRLSTFGDQQQHQNQNQPHHTSHNSVFFSLFSQGFAYQIKQQRDEIEQLIEAQGEQLRRKLGEKLHGHYSELLRAAEEVVARRLREKEAEVEKATRRNVELEAHAAKLAAEAQVWQAKARAQEAVAASLQAQLQQTMMASACASAGCHGGDDVSSAMEGQAEDAESAYVDPDMVQVVSWAAARPKCRGCGRRVASVVVLPCRHLCICTECDAHFRACPVCLTMKNSTVEVFLS